MPNGRFPFAPDAVRIYAIGDVHGCLDKLESLAWQIKQDEKDASGEVKVILLGDYVDRGSQSRETIDYLVAAQRDWGWIMLRGNHDVSMPFSALPDGGLIQWCRFGGRETLKSYGIDVSRMDDKELDGRSNELIAEFRRVAPATHERFISTLPLYRQLGDYVFVHAGISSGTNLHQQVEEDMLYIRGPFLTSKADYGFVVVHGHTPVDEVEVLPNRIGIDTGAVFGGRLTAIALEIDKRWLLQC
jgi:serine/threonine protein phosphatase 1